MVGHLRWPARKAKRTSTDHQGRTKKMLHTPMFYIAKLTRFWVLALIMGGFLSRENANGK